MGSGKGTGPRGERETDFGAGAVVTPGGNLSSAWCQQWDGARKGPAGHALSSPHSPGQTQAGPSAGKAGAGASEQWAQVAERAGEGADLEQREDRKW